MTFIWLVDCLAIDVIGGLGAKAWRQRPAESGFGQQP